MSKDQSALLGGDGRGAVLPYPNPCHYLSNLKALSHGFVHGQDEIMAPLPHSNQWWPQIDLGKLFSRALSKECVSWMRFRKKHNIHLWWRWKGKEQHHFRTDLEGRYYTFFWILDSKTTSQVNKTMHIVQIHNKYKLNIENSSKLNRAHQIYFYVKRCWNAEKPLAKVFETLSDQMVS